MTTTFKPLDGQFRVNAFTTGDQVDPNIAENPATGGFQIVWASDGQDGDGWGVVGRNFKASGATDGGEIMINTLTIGNQTNPDVAFNEDGNGVWIWQSNAQLINDIDREDEPTATRAVNSIRTHTKSFGFEGEFYNNVEKERHGGHIPEDDKFSLDPRIISLGGDQFGSGSRDNDIARGGSQYLVDEFSTYTPSVVPRNGDWSRNFADDEIFPRGHTTYGDIGQVNDDTIVVVDTMTADFDGGMGIIQFQFFDRPDGERERGPAFDVSERFELEGSGLSGPAAFPRVAILKDGGFAITWQEQDQSSEDEADWHWDVFVQIFDADGTARSPVVDVHDASDGDQITPEISAAKDGGFVITYTDSDGTNIKLQRFDETGVRLGEVQTVNNKTSGIQEDSAVATLNNGKVVVTWESDDPDDTGIFARVLQLQGTGSKTAQHIVGTSDKEKFSTGAKNDYVDGGDGNDVLRGGGKNDTLIGSGGKDKVFGGSGRDYMDGGDGNDKLTGNGGPDTFVFGAGKDVAMDFDAGTDSLLFHKSLGTGGRLTMKMVEKASEATDAGLLFDFGKDELLLKGIDSYADVSDDIGFV